MKISNSVVIQRLPEDVFAYMADWSRAPEWIAGLLETTGSQLSLGAAFKDVGKFLGRRIATSWEVTEFEPNRVITVATTASPVPSVVRNLFEPVGTGTALTIVTELEPGSFFKLAGPLLSRMATRQLQANLENLKDLLEPENSQPDA